MDFDFEQIVGIIGQAATWITVFLVFLTLREMEKQRRASQKPVLIIPNVTILGFSNSNELFIASRWSNKESRSESYEVGKLPKITIYNIGTGAAKEIKIKWNFDIQSTLKSIQEYCHKNSLPIVATSENGFLTTEFNGNLFGSNIQGVSNVEHAYLLPASVTSEGLESELPATFLNLASIMTFLKAHQANLLSSTNKLSSSNFEMPILHFEIQYYDISGNKYKKKFYITTDAFAPSYPNYQFERSFSEPVFYGLLVFKEKK